MRNFFLFIPFALFLAIGTSLSGDFDGDGTDDIGIFRPSSGLWSIRGITRIYFGSSNDSPIPGDYDGNGTTEIGVFRSSSGLWAIKGYTRAYFGSNGDIPLSGGTQGLQGPSGSGALAGALINYTGSVIRSFNNISGGQPITCQADDFGGELEYYLDFGVDVSQRYFSLTCVSGGEGGTVEIDSNNHRVHVSGGGNNITFYLLVF